VALLVHLRDARTDFTFGEVADGLLEDLLLFGEHG
jgi:hypothetical protein